jgi:hypothetical protein
LYIGPGINATSVPQLLNGTVNRCVPAAYTNFIVSTAPAPSSWDAASAPFANSMQLGDQVAYILVEGSQDGSLKILP